MRMPFRRPSPRTARPISRHGSTNRHRQGRCPDRPALTVVARTQAAMARPLLGAPSMLAFDPLAFDFTRWEPWVVVAAGVLISGLVFWGGRSPLRHWGAACGTALGISERRRWPRHRTKVASVLLTDADV